MAETFNLVNSHEITAYLVRYFKGQPLLANLLCVALEKNLKKRAENIREIHDIPADAPEWLKEKWLENGPWHVFDPRKDTRLAYNTYLIAQWLKESAMLDQAWLQNTDEQGRPYRLLKISSFEDALAIAEKELKKNKSNLFGAEQRGMIETVQHFKDGFVIVRLLTKEALDIEGYKMGHCLGDGLYDGDVDAKTAAYELFSLRDRHNKPHATMKVRKDDNMLVECRGKQNSAPTERYFHYIKSFLSTKRFRIAENSCLIGIIYQEGLYYDMFNLPDNFHCAADIIFRESRRKISLPAAFSCKKSLEICQHPLGITLPDGMKIGESLMLQYLPGLHSLPENLEIRDALSLYQCGNLRSIPENISIGGSFSACFCASIERIPESLAETTGDFSVVGCPNLRTLPRRMVVKKPTYKDNSQYLYMAAGRLTLTNNVSLQALPEELEVGDDLFLYGCPNLKFPPRLMKVGGKIYTDFGIFSRPEKFIEKLTSLKQAA